MGLIKFILVGGILYGIGWLTWKFPLEVSLAVCIAAIISIGAILLNRERGGEWT